MKENAVSTVIGVVLLLALVVVGISLIGVVILSNPLPSTVSYVKIVPQVLYNQSTGQFDNLIQITHDGGDALTPDEMKIKVDDNVIPSSDILLTEPGGDLGSWTDLWSLGESLMITYNQSTPHKVDIISTAKGGENLLFSSANLPKVYKTTSWSGWDDDTEPPEICCVDVPTTGGGVLACSNIKISWVATDNTAIKSALVEFYDGSGWNSLSKGKSSSPYSWTVPYDIGSGKQIRVTVTDLAGNSASDISSSFSIIDTSAPVVSVTNPKGGESWDVGSLQDITWKVSGECDKNRLASVQLSIDHMATWSSVVDNIADSGSYQWTVSNTPSVQAYVKILVTDDAGNTGEGVSANKFTIRETTPPTVQVIQPNGGEILTVGIPYTIQWSASDTSGIDHVNIDASYDGGSSWTSLFTDLDNTGSYSWTPSVESNNAILRITAWDVFENSYSDLSDGGFTIQPGSTFLVTLITPNGGENLVSGNIYQIQWNVEDAESTDQAVLEYSTENGVDGSWKSIGTVTSSQQYSWTIPCDLSDSIRVKVTVTRSGGTTGFDSSSGSFTISSPLSTAKVLLPNGGEILEGGSSSQIQWTASNYCGITGIDLLISQDNGVSWESIVIGTTNSGSYTWSVPNIESSTCKIRMVAHITSGSTVQDDSDSAFEIRNAAPDVTVTSPNGGEQWETGSEHDITWTATDSDDISSVKIEYSTNNGLTWTTVASALTNTGTYTWTVPTPTTIQGLIRVTATDTLGNSGEDQSDAVFKVINGVPQVTVTYPNGGQSFSTDESITITWTATDPDGVSTVDLAYSINDNPFTFSIVDGISNSGSHSWTIPTTPSDKVRVIVTAYDSHGGKASDQSDNFFTIADTISPTITISKPVAGETFLIYNSETQKNPYQIIWTASDNVNVVRIYLEYSLNGGTIWIPIIDNLSNNGYYYWYVPEPISDNCIVKAWAYDDAGNSASSISGIFKIRYKT